MHYRVQLLTMTPLGNNPLVIESSDEVTARAMFDSANGIVQPRDAGDYRIREATEKEIAEQKKRDREAAGEEIIEPSPTLQQCILDAHDAGVPAIVSHVSDREHVELSVETKGVAMRFFRVVGNSVELIDD